MRLTVCIVALTLVSSGCGDNLATVSGVVTLDGKPLRGGNGVRATVFFQPTGGSGAAAVGMVDEAGKYNLSSGSQQGVAPGDYVVTCTATQIIPSKDPGNPPSGRRITPAKYGNATTSGLQFSVGPGDSDIDLALSTTN